MDVRSPFFQNVATVLIGVLFLNPIIAAAAEVTLTAANTNTSVTAAGNGVPVVNIATPNGNGLSHNKFTDYSVGQQGLILNNSTAKTQSTQLGGIILGNANLKGQTANLILNEVTGGSPSQLRGYTEVAGQQAHVVVANPHGITCNGCGFINTPRATLSTGRPVLEGGRLTGYDVDGGSIAVQGAGLNASNVSQFDLITRSAEINADIHAQQLNIIAGRNQVDAGTLQATQKAADGSAQPALAIDSSALGGMYAGAIRLVGTEAGVGVRLAGDMAASAGDLTISSNGQLTVGKALVQGNANLQAQGIALTDDMHANGSVRAEAVNEINNAKTLSARGNLRLAATAVDNSGAIEAGVDSDGGSHTDSELRVESDTFDNNGRITAQGRLQVQARELRNDDGEIVSGQRGEINAAEVHNQHGKLIGQTELALNSQTLDNRAGTIASNQHLHISASDRLDNQNDGLILAKEEELSVNARTLNNQGGVLQANQGNLQLTGEQANNQGGKLLAGQGNLTVAQSQALNNSDGLISALAGSVSLSTGQGNLSNNSGRIQGGQVSVVAGNTLDNDSGRVISTQGALSLSAADELRNTHGVLQAPGQLSLNARRLDNGSGQIGASLISATLTDSLNNSEGLIEAANILALSAGELDNRDGRLRALGESGASRLDFAHLENQSGLIEVGNARFSLNGEHISNQNGTIRHLGNEAFTFNWAAVGQAGGDFITNADLSYSASQWSNESNLQANSFDLNIGSFEQLTGRLVSVGDMRLSGGDINNDGLLASDGRLRLALTGLYQGFGDLQSLGDLHLEAGNFVLGEAAQARSAGNTTVLVSGLFDNYGSLTSRGDLSVRAGSVQVQYGTLGSDRQLRIETGTLDSNSLLFSGGDMALYLRELRNTGSIYSLEALTLAAGENLARAELLENLSGSIESAGDMRLNVRQLRNDRAFYLSEQRLQSGSISIKCYDCSGDHHNVDYIAREASQTYVLQDSGAALIHSGRNLQIAAGTVDNLKSTLSASGNVDISADTLNNHGEAIDSIVRTQTFNTGRVTDGTDERFRARHIYPYNSAPLPKALPDALSAWTKVSDIETRTAVAPGAVAIIQAGGNVSIQATQSIDNDSVRSLQAAQGGAGHSIDSAVSGQSQPLVVRLNSQAAPDSRQQAVDPLGLPGFSLPQGKGGLFRVVSEPGRRYLVETNPQFASLQGFLNSDYLLSRLGYQPDVMQKRLGDGLYEQRLIRDAISARTGQRFIAGINSDEAMFRYLMDNAIASKSALSLSVGVALSAEQVAALTHDIVWMEEREVRGQQVLVPVLYLAQASGRLAPSGSLIQGQDVALISGNSLSNKGTLRASNNLTATANKIDNSGLMQAGERISLLATDSISNARGGLIAGKDVTAIALTGDITNERTVSQQQRSGRGFSQLTSVVDKAAGIEASNDLALSAGRDIQNIGGSLKAGGNASLTAGQDLVIASAEAENGQMRKDKRHFWSTSSVTQYGSEVQVGGDLSADAKRDLAVVASQVKAGGNVELDAGRDVSLLAATNESSSEYRYKGNGKKINKEDSVVRQQAAVIEAGGDLDVNAGSNLVLSASQLKAGGEAYLYAGEQLALLAAQNSDYHLYDYKKKGSFGSNKTQRDETTTVRNVGSSVEAGGDITLVSEGDQLYQRARLESGGDLTLESGGAITFEGVKDLDQESHEKSSSDLAWTSAKGKGKTDEALLQSQLIAQGDIVIKAVEGLKVDIKQVNQQSVSQTIDAMVKADPQLAWLKQAEARGDVDWRRVKEVHDSFKYNNSGLGAGAQLVIAIVASAFLGPIYGAMATNVAVGTASNGGDIGQGIKFAASSDNLKSYAVIAATQWATTEVFDGTLKTKTDPMTGKVTTDLSSLEGIGRFGANQLLQNTTSTGLSKMLGMDAEWSDVLHNSALNTLNAAMFNAVGDFSKQMQWADGGPQKVALHALVGGLLNEAAGGDFKTGAIAAGANELLVDQLAALVKNDQNMQVMASQLVGLVAAASVDGDVNQGATIARDATNYNRLLHPDEEEWLKKHAKEFAATCGCGISEQQAMERLSQQAMREVDYLWRAQLTDGDDLAAQSFLKDTRQTFVNDLGERQKLFTTEGLQLFRPEMFGDTADTTFYKQFVHSGISRSLSAGLTKELQDSGLAMKDGAFDLGKAVLEHPGLVVESVFEAVAGLPQSVRDGLVESGVSIGEGAAVSFDENLTDKLNAIYGTDISGAQTALLAIRTVAAISGAGAAGKAGGKLTKELAEAVGKKLDKMGRAWESGKVLSAGEVAMSGGGNISAQQITRVGTPAGLNTAEVDALSKLDSLDSNEAGVLRETVSNSYFERNGFTALDGKCGANCFDGVYVKGNQVIVNEVKPLSGNGSIKLSSAQPSGLPTQGTIEWVLDRANYLKSSSDPVLKQTGQKVLDAYGSGNLTTVVSGVNSNGMVIVKVKL